MTQENFLENITTIHQLFEANETKLHALKQGITNTGSEQNILDELLDTLDLEKNDETRYIAYARMCDKKFEPLESYLRLKGVSEAEREKSFDASYKFVSTYYRDLQVDMLSEIKKQNLLTDFYRCIFEYTHEIGKIVSEIFVLWNVHLREQNTKLEHDFDNNTGVILNFLQSNNLLDTDISGDISERSYSLLVQDENGEYSSQTYASIFPEEIARLIKIYENLISDLEKLEDKVYDSKSEYIQYFKANITAWQQTDTSQVIEDWNNVDRAWMQITTPIQPGHMMEYYEDHYRKCVGIEFDLRLDDPSLFTSSVSKNIKDMYESMYDEIGRENFPESYEYSLQNQKRTELHIGAPVLQYGGFLCGAYSAQVVPNNDTVSQECGKKIFAFPKFVLESKKGAPKMQLDQEIFSEDIFQKYESYIHESDKNFYAVYDISTIGHEFGHTLWLTPGCESVMNDSGQFKNIEEFKATAGGLVAYFFSGDMQYNEGLLLDHIMRSIKIMRYRSVEDVIPYYCECLIHMHILFESGIIEYSSGKIELRNTDESFENLKNLYTAVYTQQIFAYLHQMDAANFLDEFVVRENGIFLPKEKNVRKFVEKYYTLYEKIGNKIV